MNDLLANTLGFTVIVGVAYFCIKSGLDDKGYDKLHADWDFWCNRLASRGYTLEQLPDNSSDAAPCEVQFQISSTDVRVIGHGWSIYRLVKRMAKGDVDECELKYRSKWPVSKLPI